MEGVHGDNVVETAPSGRQRRFQIGECQPDLRLEIGLGRTVGTASDLTGNEQQIAGADRGRIAVLLVQGVAVLGEDGITSWHEAVLSRAVVLSSEEHTSELQSLIRISYAVFCLKKKKTNTELS